MSGIGLESHELIRYISLVLQLEEETIQLEESNQAALKNRVNKYDKNRNALDAWSGKLLFNAPIDLAANYWVTW